MICYNFFNVITWCDEMVVLNDMNVPLFIEIKVISNCLEYRLTGDIINFNDVMFCVKDHNFE